MQVEQPSPLDRMSSDRLEPTHSKSNAQQQQQQQQQHSTSTSRKRMLSTGSQHYLDSNAIDESHLSGGNLDVASSSLDKTLDTSMQRQEHKSPSGRKPRSTRPSQEDDPDRHALNEITTVTQSQRRSSREHQRVPSLRSRTKRASHYHQRTTSRATITSSSSKNGGIRTSSTELWDDDDDDEASGSDASDELESQEVSQGANHDQDSATVTNLSAASGAGSRRGSQTLHQFHRCQHHHHYHNHHICNATSATTPSSVQNGHQTHARNFSSPSLLDSLTSPDPVASPIQTYFGSDPNSPATSFSLPRHDNYSHLSIDPSATLDGYHGFATQPWSEQSSTPSRAFSHRWTRRSSHDTYPSCTKDNDANTNAPRQRHSTIVYSESFAPAVMDPSWNPTPSSLSNVDAPVVIDDYSDVDEDEDEQDTVSDDLMQDSNDEAEMDEGYSGYESTHESHFGYSVDEDEDMDENEDFSYDYPGSSVDGEGETSEQDDIGGKSRVNMEDPLNNDLGDDRETNNNNNNNSSSINNVLVGRTHGSRLMEQMLGAETFVSSSSAAAGDRSLPSPSPALSHRASSPEQGAPSTESDEALARRLQDEEYAALLGERYLPPRRSFTEFLSSRSRFHQARLDRIHRAEETRPSDLQFGSSLLSIPASSGTRTRDREHAVGRELASRILRRPTGMDGIGPTTRSGRSSWDSLRADRSELTTTERAGLHRPYPSLFDRHGVREHSRSPPQSSTSLSTVSSSSSSSSSTLSSSSLWPGIRSEARYFDLLRDHRFMMSTSEGRRWDGTSSEHMWGNPGDYMTDGQVDESYEGLLRLSERIGDVKPKGVPMHVLKRMDKHIVSWKHMKGRNVTLSVPLESHQGDMKDFMSTLESSSSSRPITRSYGFRRDTRAKVADEVIEENCTICLQVYNLSDRLRPLPCKHAFHVECIDTWLRSNIQCPICRQEVNATSVESIV